MLAILGDLPLDLRLDDLDVVGADATRRLEPKPTAVLESLDHSTSFQIADAARGAVLHAANSCQENRRNYSLDTNAARRTTCSRSTDLLLSSRGWPSSRRSARSRTSRCHDTEIRRCA